MDYMKSLSLVVPKKIDLEFSKVTYKVAVDRKTDKHVLKGVSGVFKSGELTAIMGPSGAGKTSLLNILTGFQKSGTKGTIKSTGAKEDIKTGTKKYKKHSCYILQDDNLDPLFTVKEIMHMAASLKLGQSISEKAQEFLIDDILETLGLKVCEKTKCQKLSGGQRKRLSVALELIDNPPVMFLDEPTTGLDSLSSFQCISMLKSLAKGGRNIICTIHQPSATLYEMFDLVYVMAEGKCVFQGDSKRTVEYLANSGFQCPQYHNPADYLIEVANCEYGNYTDMLEQKALEVDRWRKPCDKVKIVQMEVKEKDGRITGDADELCSLTESNSEKFTPSEFCRLQILIKRAYVKMYRDWTISFLRLFLHIAVGIFLGFTYLDAGNNGSKVIPNVGFFLVSAVYLGYTSLMPAVLRFPSEIAIIRKERFNNWYNLKTFYTAFLVADIPMQIVFSIAYTSVSYVISGQLLDPVRFVMVTLVMCLVSLIASSTGVIFGTLVNPINGTFLGAITFAVMLVVAGFLILFTHMSGPMYILSYFSYLSYALEALVQAAYGYSRGAIPCPDEADYCHFTSPKTLLKELGMDKQNYWIDIVILCGQFLVLRLVAYCTLKKKLSTI